MKAPVIKLGLFLLLVTTPAIAQTSDKNTSGLTSDTSTFDSLIEVKADLYERFVANRLENADAAYEAGKEYLKTYGPVDGSDDPYVVYIKKWVAFYEKLAQDKEKFRPDDINKRIYSPREVTEKARVTFKPEPVYTEEARIKSVHGTVILKAVFRASGEVTDIKTVTELSSGLTEKAIDAARQITFVPAVKDGRLVSQFVKITYNFNLH